MQAYVNEGRQAMGPSYLKVGATLLSNKHASVSIMLMTQSRTQRSR